MQQQSSIMENVLKLSRKRKNSAMTAGLPQKGKQTSESSPSVHHPEGPNQVLNVNRKRKQSTKTTGLPQNRKQASEACASTPSEQHPQEPNKVPSAQANPLDVFPRSQSSIGPDELPVVSSVGSNTEAFTAALLQDRPLRIHGYSVVEYQQIYHEVVDIMLKDKNGKPRAYSLDLGRRIKQKLWERLNCPRMAASFNTAGPTHVDMS